MEARVNEIIQNVWLGQVPPEYYDKLLGGIILTGGGSKMKNIKKAFTAVTDIQKIRIAGTVNQKVSSTDKDINAHDGMMNTALGLLAKGDLNCSGSVIKPTADIFDTEGQTSSPVEDIPKIKNKMSGEPGRVESPDEKLLRKKKHSSEDKTRQAAPKDPPKGGWLSRGYRILQDFGTKIISPENDD